MNNTATIAHVVFRYLVILNSQSMYCNLHAICMLFVIMLATFDDFPIDWCTQYTNSCFVLIIIIILIWIINMLTPPNGRPRKIPDSTVLEIANSHQSVITNSRVVPQSMSWSLIIIQIFFFFRNTDYYPNIFLLQEHWLIFLPIYLNCTSSLNIIQQFLKLSSLVFCEVAYLAVLAY